MADTGKATPDGRLRKTLNRLAGNIRPLAILAGMGLKVTRRNGLESQSKPPARVAKRMVRRR